MCSVDGWLTCRRICSEYRYGVSVYQEWTDYQLMWDKANFGGIHVIRIMPTKVWKPDIVLFNKYDIFVTTDSLLLR